MMLSGILILIAVGLYGAGLVATLVALYTCRVLYKNVWRAIALAFAWPVVALIAFVVHLGLMHDTSGEWHRN